MASITIPRKLNTELKSFIVQAVLDVLNDPDFGWELTKNAKQRLQKPAPRKQKTIPFSEIKRKYY